MGSRGSGKKAEQLSVDAFTSTYNLGVVDERTRLLATLNRINVPAARGLNPETDDIVEVVDKTMMGMISAFKELSMVMGAQRTAMVEELMRCPEKVHEPFKKALSDGERLDK